MIHIVTATNRDAHRALLRDMHRDRKRVFVDRFGWQVPVVDGELEIDQFDTDAAVYLVAASPEGRHWGSTRLLPSTAPHILGDLFPELADGAPPRGADVWETTRLVYSPDIRDMALLDRIRMTLRAAMLEHALAEGIRGYSCIVRMEFLPAILASGWRVTPLGLPREIGGETCTAVLLEDMAAALAATRERAQLAGPVLLRDRPQAALAA
ncbi:MAG: autoinducer synthase [Alphaproteobacteria bacterium]|nr:autoinducer synthase [Alphaproteobacteria bacterium]